MAQSLVMDNSNTKQEASVMHNLRSSRMMGSSREGSVSGHGPSVGERLNSHSTEGRMNEARQNARADASLNMRMAGANAKDGAKAKAEDKNIRGGALKQKKGVSNNVGKVRSVKGTEGGGMAFQQATSGVLRQAWIAVIPSWGLSLLWINIHAFMRWVFPMFFCKLGSEWIPKQTKKVSKTPGSFAFIIESMALIFADSLALILITSVVALLVIVAGFWVRVLIGGIEIWHWAWETVAH